MSYLAEVEMPKTEPDGSRAEPEMDEIEMREEVEISEVAEEVEEQSDDGVEEEEVLPPPPTKKDKLKSEDIFKRKKPPAKQTAPVPEISPLTVNHESPIIPSEKPVKKKRQMSEKQLAALARGREARAAKKKAKAQSAPQPKSEPKFEAPPPTPQPQQEKLYSQKEVEELIFQGVSRYDTIRKQQKVEKRKTQAKKAHEQKVFSTINTAMTSNNPDPYANCFSF